MNTPPSKDKPPTLDLDLLNKLDGYSLEYIVELKVSRFLDQLGQFYPKDLYHIIINKCEKPIIEQILRRVGGNQFQASQILGINRNTLRKRIKAYQIKV